jgi:hypothetical protein
MKILPLTFILLSASLSLVSCANKKHDSAVKELYFCSGDECERAEQQYSTAQLLQSFKELLQSNTNVEVPMCNADPQKRTCKSPKICHFVLGGILPGNGCSKYLIFDEVDQQEQAGQLAMKTKMPLTFIGTPVQCKTAASVLSVNSSSDISLQLKPHFCSWMVTGVMTAELDFAVEFINLDKGEIGGYWRHRVKGTGNGSGSGYLILKFPKNIVWPRATIKTVSINP